MRTFVVCLLFLCLAVAPGCYHATVETGLTPSTEVIHETFASSWIYGLVPPNTITAQLKCTHGVAKVETQLTFVNQLVGFLTLGIYTPMDIKVTCASGGSMGELFHMDMVLPDNASPEAVQATFSKAADLAVTRGKPAYVKY